MTRFLLGGAAAAALCVSAVPGWSLTAQDAWDNWKTLASSMGQEVTAEAEATAGGQLTVSGVRFGISVEETAVVGTIDEMVFAEQGDGTVRITMSDSYDMSADIDTEGGERAVTSFNVSMPGLEMIAREDGARIAYDYAAPAIAVAMNSLEVADESVPLELTMTLNGVQGVYAADPDGTSMESDFSSDSADLVVSARDPEGEGTFSMTATFADLSSSTTGAGLMMMGMGDIAAMLEEGFSTDGNFSFGATTFDMDFADGAETFAAQGSMTGGRSSVTLDGSAMKTAATYEGLEFTASGSEIPFPQVTGALGEWTTDLALPLSASESVEPFALRLALVDLVVGEEIWSMFDPAGAMARDALTAVVDLSGTARLLVDLLDEEAMLASDEPAQIESLTLEELRLSAAGAQLTGTGAFTFDNADRTTFGGMPAPDGAVNLSLTGGNALLDTLVNMGFVPQEQAMMVRMMTGMIAKPGPGADELVSEISVRPDGTILANGAPLPF